ncbi:MAG: ABC transporter ATP-binding protein [Clostridia bacterium]|nr:ABC transporter ATP-binding protein [Clostridia bacterium]
MANNTNNSKNKNIIEIKNSKKYFGEVKAVDDISFSVKQGDLFAFLGLNGAGKSTTINIMCDILQKDSGEVYINNYSIDDSSDKIKADLGIVFQQSVLDEKLTVYDNLYYRAMLYNLTETEFKQNLNFYAEKLDFKDILKRPFGKLSGGQKRRIDIARALIHNPKILILDEPTTGLDPKTRILVWDLISYLRKEKQLTVFLTTHYMEEASEADDVVIIDSGKIVAHDTPNKLKNKYANDFVKIYDWEESLIKKLEKDNYDYLQQKEFIEVKVKNILEAKNFVVKYEKLIKDFEVIKGKMDNVFLNVTGKVLKEF